MPVNVDKKFIVKELLLGTPEQLISKFLLKY